MLQKVKDRLDKMGTLDRVCIGVAVGLHVAGLFLGGILGSAALISLITVGGIAMLLSHSILRKLLKAVTRNPGVVDLIASSLVIWWAVGTGTATVAAAGMLTGVLVSAAVRILQLFRPEIEALEDKSDLLSRTWNWCKSKLSKLNIFGRRDKKIEVEAVT